MAPGKWARLCDIARRITCSHHTRWHKGNYIEIPAYAFRPCGDSYSSRAYRDDLFLEKGLLNLLISRLPRPLVYALATVLCIAGLAAAHLSRIIENWHTTQWEDSLFFRYNDAHIYSLTDCFVKGGPWPGLYRPLSTNLYYYLGSRLLDNRVESYHVVNLVFVILNAVLLFRLAELLLGTWCAMIPAVLFASRIAMVEVVLNTCEFQGLSYTFFTIISVDLFVRSYRSDSAWPLTLSAFAFVLALFSKESAIVLPAVLVVYGWLFEDHIVTLRYLVHALI